MRAVMSTWIVEEIYTLPCRSISGKNTTVIALSRCDYQVNSGLGLNPAHG